MAEALELSSANRIRQLAGMPAEAEPPPKPEEPPAWSEIKDSEDYKTLTYPEQVNLAQQWGAETKQYASTLPDYTPEQDAEIDDFVNTQAVDVPTNVKVAAGAAGLVKGSASVMGGIAGGLGGLAVGGPIGAVVGGIGGSVAAGQLAEAGLQKFTPNVARAGEFAPGYQTAGQYAPEVVMGTVGAKQLVQAGKTLFQELGAKRAAQELGKTVGVSAVGGAGIGSAVRAITGGEVTARTIAEDALFNTLYAGLGSGSRVKGYNFDQFKDLNYKVKAGRATPAEVRDWQQILGEAQRTEATGIQTAKRTEVQLGGRRVLDKVDLEGGAPTEVRPYYEPLPAPTSTEIQVARPQPQERPIKQATVITQEQLPEAGVRGGVRGTQADTAAMQRRGIITPMQESLVDLNDPVPKTNVFTTESQGMNREAIIPDTRGLQGEIVREGPIVTPRTQLPSGEMLALPAERKLKDANAIEKIPFLNVVIDNKTYGKVRTFEEASRKYALAREESQLKSSELPPAELVDESGKTVAFVSYNGKVWAGDKYKPGQTPLYNPFDFGESIPQMTREQMLEKAAGILKRKALREEIKASKTSIKLKEKSTIPSPINGTSEIDVNDERLYGEGQFTYTGKSSKTKGPIDIIYTEDGRLLVEDGWHRIQDAKKSGKSKILANITDENGNPLIKQGNKYVTKEEYKKSTIPRPMRGKAGEAGFIVSDVQEGAAKVAQKWLTTEGNLPKEMFDIMEAKGSRTQAMLKQIDFTLKDLSNAARELNGKPKLTPDQSLQVDQFLRGYLPAENLPEAIRPVAQQMRRQLDNLSEGLIQSGVFSQEVGPSGMSKADMIRMNKGEYLTRSYEKFDNPKFNVELLKKRDLAKYTQAETFVRNELKAQNPSITEEEVQGRIREIVEQGRDKPMESMIQASGIGKKLGITKARQDIPEQIRYLMGEYNDPIINYARSASKMINLLQSQQQLNKLKEFGIANKLFFEKPTGTAVKQIAADGSDTRSPLNGLYAEPDLVDAIENFEMFHKGGTAFQLYSMANAWVKWGKTVGSIQAQFRNPISNVLIEVVNGNFNFGGSLKPVKTILAEFGVPSVDTKEGRAYLTRAAQLGVYDNTVLNEFTQMLKDAQSYKGSTIDLAEELAGKSSNVLKRGVEALNKTYRAGDNLFKLMAWENETKQLMDGRGLPRQEAEVIAAERVKNTRPTYSRVPRIIKAFRLQPLIGQFVSWPSEMLRILPNTVRYAAEDFKTPGMRKYAFQRVAGMLLGTTALIGIVRLGMWATGFNDRKVDALRRFVAPYQKNASLMPTGMDGKDVGYVDVSYTSPYEIFFGPVQAAISGRDPEESILGAIKDFTESYIGPSILANSIISAYYGKAPQGRTIRNPQDTFTDQSLDTISYLLRQNEPATISQVRRIAYALTGQPDTTVSKYGRIYKPSEELSALFGIRPQSINVSKALESKASRFNTDMADVGRIFTETYGAVGNVPEAKVREQFDKMQNRRRIMFDEANKDFHAAMLLGLSRSEAISAMRAGGMGVDNASAIANNKYRDYKISKSLTKSMRRELSPEEMQKRQEIGRELMMQQGE
jgi:hypothetical protein